MKVILLLCVSFIILGCSNKKGLASYDTAGNIEERSEKENSASKSSYEQNELICPNCKSTYVGKFFYGYYNPEEEDSATIEAVENKRLIPGGCVITSMSPKYKCNSCSYTWGNYNMR